MTTTTHKATCTCCGTGELTITVDDAGTWSSTDCPNCKRPPLSMSPESHAALMRAHERAKMPANILFARDDIVRHKRSGHTYQVLGRCVIEATLADCYMYRGTDGQTWIRPVSEMEDGRFELMADAGSAP